MVSYLHLHRIAQEGEFRLKGEADGNEEAQVHEEREEAPRWQVAKEGFDSDRDQVRPFVRGLAAHLRGGELGREWAAVGARQPISGFKFATKGGANGKEGTQTHEERQETPRWQTPGEGVESEVVVEVHAASWASRILKMVGYVVGCRLQGFYIPQDV